MISKAHMKMEEGRGHRGEGSHTKFLELFRQAVQLFRDASQLGNTASRLGNAGSQLGNAAYCLEEMNRFEEAGGESPLQPFVSQNDRNNNLYNN